MLGKVRNNGEGRALLCLEEPASNRRGNRLRQAAEGEAFLSVSYLNDRSYDRSVA